jgi:hypothetical protein
MVTPVYQGYLSEFFRGIKDDESQPVARENLAEYNKWRGKEVVLPSKFDNKPGF